jgi:hypothetical protein
MLHLQYEFDLDNGAGGIHNPEGVTTLNDMVYQRIPVEDIPVRPLINPYRAFRADSTGYPWVLDTTLATGPTPPTAQDFRLYQNYPNPFNPETHIQFDLRNAAEVTLTVYDVTGREVARLLDQAAIPAGTQTCEFDGRVLASGVYFYRLETPAQSITRKMILLK